MPDLTPEHPAVEAAMKSTALDTLLIDLRPRLDRRKRVAHLLARFITAALPHLTADDLRDTDAADEICTEGWLQGWAAGRDLDGDEDATPYLRDTPAGRALMAEAWDRGWVDRKQYDQDIDWRTIPITDTNPYRKEDNA